MNMNDDTYLKNLLGAFATTLSTQIDQEVAGLGGRSLSHEVALVAIRNHPNDSIDRLSKVLGLTHSGAVRLINTLEEEKLVLRHRSKDDARAVVLRVTAKGHKRANNVLAARERVTTQILDSLSADQRKAITPALENALAVMTDDAPGARRICRLCDEGVCRSQGCPVEQSLIQ